MSKEKTIPVSVVCKNDTEIELLKQHNDGVKKLTSSQVDNLILRIIQASTYKSKEITTTTLDLNGALDVSTTTTLAGVVTVNTGIIPDADDGAYLGTASAGFADLFLADGGTITMGNDQDVTITHDPDDGLFMKSVATGDDQPVLLSRTCHLYSLV